MSTEMAGEKNKNKNTKPKQTNKQQQQLQKTAYVPKQKTQDILSPQMFHGTDHLEGTESSSLEVFRSKLDKYQSGLT